MKKVLSKMVQRVLIVNKSYPTAGLEVLHSNGLETTVLPYVEHDERCLPEIKKALGGYDGLIWNTKYRLDKDMLDLAGPKLKAITSMSSGLDHMDLAEIKRRGIPLGRSPGALDDAVADITLGILIAAARKFKEGVRMLESGQWKYGVQWLLGQDISGSTVGIVGFGGVGQAVARRLKGFGVARFLYSGRSDKPEAAEFNALRVPLEQLLRESDHVILSCPLTDETRYLINKDTLAIMKSNAVLVNIARGDIIDHDALLEALKSGQIFAAALDVTTPEPMPNDHPLVQLENCYIIPHLGSATFKTRNGMATIAANNIVRALQGNTMEVPVTL